MDQHCDDGMLVKRGSHQLGPGLKPIIDYGVASSAPGGWDRQSVPASEIRKQFVDRDVYIADTEIATARKEQKHREKGARNMVAQQ
ncbi:hypothetical protein HaLaN_15688, partial [Haematococcus lacustris]